MYAFGLHDPACALSSGRSLDYASKLFLSVGDALYASDSSVMFTIVADSVRRHDFTLTPCSQQMFEKLYGATEHHSSCFENLVNALSPHGIRPEQIGTTFNVFMHVTFDESGRIEVGCPLSRAGDYIELRAEIDLPCGLTACSPEGSNNGTFKPIDFRIRKADAVAPVGGVRCDFVWRRSGAQIVGTLEGKQEAMRKYGPGTCTYMTGPGLAERLRLSLHTPGQAMPATVAEAAATAGRIELRSDGVDATCVRSEAFAMQVGS